MICKKCSATIPDDSEFCPNCGAVIAPGEESAPQDAAAPATEETAPQETPAAEKGAQKDAAGVWKAATAHLATAKGKGQGGGFNLDYVGVIIGAICIVVGLFFLLTASCSVGSTSFGADFYTYAYRGIVAIAETATTIVRLLALLLIALGALVDCHYLQKLSDGRKKEM